MEVPHRTRIKTILLVEDFEPFRRFIRFRLQNRPEFHIIGEVSDGDEAVAQAEALKPDLIILDISLPSIDGLTAARKIRAVAPGAKIIFLTEELEPELIRVALETGANGYVAKVDAVELIDAIDAVLAGQIFLSRAVSKAHGEYDPGMS